MATAGSSPSQPTSAEIRRTIGRARSLLTDYLREYSDLPIIDPTLPTKNLLLLQEKSEQLISKIEQHSNTIEKKHEEWLSLCKNNSGEEEVRSNYIVKYGDYKADIFNTPNVLSSLRELNQICSKELDKRKKNDDSDDLFRPSSPFSPKAPIQIQNSSAPPPILVAHDLARSDIQPFQGDVAQYQNFKQIFRALYEIPQFHATQRMSALINLLRGTPHMMISSMPLNESSYNTAWSLLDKFYGHTASNFRLLFQQLHDIAPTDGRDQTSLQFTYASCYRIFQQLQQFHAHNDSTSISLTILKKFPRRITSKLRSAIDSDLLDPEQILTEIAHMIQQEMRIDTLYNKPSGHPIQTFHARGTLSSSRTPSQGTHGNSSHNQKQFNPANSKSHRHQQCPFCHEGHTAFDCTLNTGAKYSACFTHNLCKNCLRSGHFTQQCLSTKNCQHCNRRHHSALHDHEFRPRLFPKTPRITPNPHFEQSRFEQSRQYPRNHQQNSSSQFTPRPFNNGYHAARPFNNGTQRNTLPFNNTTRQFNNHQTNAAHRQPQQVQNRIQQAVQTVLHNVHHTTVNENINREPQQSPPETPSVHAVTLLPMSPPMPDSELKHEEKAKTAVPLLCLRLKVQNPTDPTKTATVHAFLDTGSTTSFISESLAKQLDLNCIRQTTLDIDTFGQQQASSRPSSVHHITLLPAREFTTDETNNTTISLDVFSLPHLTNEIDTVLVSEWPDTEELTTVQFENTNVQPELLLGTDILWNIINLGDPNFSCYNFNEYQVITTSLGPLVITRNTRINKRINNLLLNNNSSDGHNIATAGMHEKSISISEDSTNPIPSSEDAPTTSGDISKMSKEDKEVYQFFLNTVQYDPQKKRYAIRWPLKTDKLLLPDSRAFALKKQCFVFRQLHEKDLQEKYIEYFKEMLKLGVIEQVPPEELHNDRQNYLLHFAVLRDNSLNTKIRPVFNASAINGNTPSLNNQMHRGPILNASIWELLINNRFPTILLSSDIAKAFLMVELQESDRDLCRFLLPATMDYPFSRFNCVDMRFKRMPFGPTASPSLLNCVIQLHLQKFFTDELHKNTAQEISRSIYVDNIFLGAETEEEAKAKFAKCNDIFTEAGMKVREWCSNNDNLNNYFIEKDEDNRTPQEGKLLGLKWNKQTDCYGITPTADPNHSTWTKRKVLQFTNSTFDPIGFLLPLITTCKIFLHMLSEKGYTFDTTLSSEDQDKWLLILQNWPMTTMWIPRRLSRGKLHLHVFCDASQHACAAVAYVTNSTDPPQLIAAISRVASLSTKQTIPRLELNSLLMGTRLTDKLQTLIPNLIQSITVWSDAAIALFWLSSATATAKQPVYVRNRVEQIHKIVNKISIKFRHTPGSENPADIATRPIKGSDFLAQSTLDKWLHGPAFLRLPSNEWPSLPIDNTPSITTLAAIAKENETDYADPTPTIPISNYSTFSTLLNVVVYILLFIQRISKGRLPKTLFSIPTSTTIGFPAQIQEFAQLYICQIAQQEEPPTTQDIARYNLYRSTNQPINLWHCHVRTTVVTGDPIWLPPNHPSTRLRILHIHKKGFHCGVTHILAELRQKFFTPRARGIIKQTLNGCHECKRIRQHKFQLPEFAPLPSTRLSRPIYIFESTGIDYAGPIMTLVDGQVQKVWIALATCLASRYTFCDIVRSLDTDHFLLFLRRLSALHGYPRTIICDNQRSFVAAANLLSPDGQHALHQFSTQRTCSFRFTTPHAPWKGGIYERLIGILKTSLRNCMKNRTLDIESLRTVLLEATRILNERPLTYMSDREAEARPLRPIDLMFSTHTNIPPFPLSTMTTSPASTTAVQLRDSLNSAQLILDDFWMRFQQEYLPTLQNRWRMQHHHSPGDKHRSPHIGEIVIVRDSSNSNRYTWPLGRILELPSTGTALVSINNKQLLRPFNELIPLEIQSEIDNVPRTSTSTTANTPETHTGQTPQPAIGSTHPMKLRSHTRSLLTVVTLLLTLTTSTSCTILTHVPVTTPTTTYLTTTTTTLPQLLPQTKMETIPTCGDTDRIHWFTPCSDSGIVFGSNQEKLTCRLHFQCTFGEKSPSISKPTINNRHICSSKWDDCSCPPWANGCLHYNGIHRSSSSNSTIHRLLQTLLPTQICSLQNTTKCPAVRTGTFTTIELFDKTLHPVESLKMRFAEVSAVDDALCIDELTTNIIRLQTVTSNITRGTEQFCTYHPCSPNATYFCFFESTQALLQTGDDSLPEIPIFAWGQYQFTYFTNLPDADHHDCNIICNEHLQIHTTCSEAISTIQVCTTHDNCVMSSVGYASSTFPIPTHLFSPMDQHIVTVTVFKLGAHFDEHTIQCQPPRCSNCQWCFTYFDCWTKLDLLLATIIITIGCSVTVLITCCTRTLHYLLIISLLPIRLFLKLLHYASQTCINISPSPPRTWKPLATITLLLVTTPHYTLGDCAINSVITGSTVQCLASDDNAQPQCTLRGTASVSLPAKDSSCLQLGDPNQNLGQFEFNIQSIQQSCSKEIMYFTRSHSFEVDSSHRCAHAGSCKDDFCETMNTSTTVKEFSSAAVRSPGYSFCHPSCGCLTCGGCILCSSSCVFYRHYAVPLEPTVYSVFRCSTWKTTVTVAINFTSSHSEQYFTIKLPPGITHNIPELNITLQLISSSIPNIPALQQTYVEDEHGKTTQTTASPTNQPLPGFVGQLQCSSLEEAHSMNCSYSADVCKCRLDDYSASCDCTTGDIKNFYGKGTLPIKQDAYIIRNSNGTITAITNIDSSAELRLFFNSMVISIAHQVNTNITIGPLIGCYSCAAGADIAITCESTRNVRIQLRCTKTTRIVECETNRTNRTTTTHKFHFDEPSINEKCTYNQNGQQKEVMITGTLKAGENNIDFNYKRAGAHSFIPEFSSPSLEAIVSRATEIFNSIVNYYVIFIIFIVMLFSLPLYHSLKQFTLVKKIN